MRLNIIFILLILSNTPLFSQQNLIPNASFEQYTRLPSIWLPWHTDFEKTFSDWYSPNCMSPDLVSPEAPQNKQFERGTFGVQKPHNGKAVLGLRIFANSTKAEDKNAYGDYVGIKLLKNLQKDSLYRLSFWINKRLDAALASDNIGVLFSDTLIYRNDCMNLIYTPDVNITNIEDIDPKTWKRVTFTFKAKSAANYMLVGNFLTAQKTHTKATKYVYPNIEMQDIAYYYFDSFELVPQDAPLIAQTAPLVLPLKNAPLVLENIYFKTGKADILPSSYHFLDRLAASLLSESPAKKYEIAGHTDNKGSLQINQILSEQRAEAVFKYLISKGVDKSRLTFKGYADTQPIAPNDTEENRQRNRRVELWVKGL